MIANIKTNGILKRIITIILTLHKFSKFDIEVFCEKHLVALRHGIVTPEKQLMIDELTLVYSQIHDTNLMKSVNIGQTNTSVKVIKGSKDYIKNELQKLQSKIDILSNCDYYLTKRMHLHQKSLFYSGKETNRKRYFSNLRRIVSRTPVLAPLLPEVTLLVKTITDLYKTKTSHKVDIDFETTSVRSLMAPLQKVLLKNYGKLLVINIDNLSLMSNFFPLIKMTGRKKSPDFVYKYQTLVKVLCGKMINAIGVKFKHENFLKVENKSKCDVRIFLSTLPNPLTIPDYAVLVTAGSKVVVPFRNLGSSTQLYLIFAAVTPGEEAILKVSVRKTK